jgi:hypothetical protein
MCGIVVIVFWKKLRRLGVSGSVVVVAGQIWVKIHVDILAGGGGGGGRGNVV